jgi:hypothetical protein
MDGRPMSINLYNEVEEVPLNDWKRRNWLERCVRHDANAVFERESWARELARLCYRGDKRAEQIFRRNMYFRNGEVDREPKVVQGIIFYQVDQNESHCFYAGLKNGKLFRCSIGEEILLDADGNEIPDEHGQPMMGIVTRVAAAKYVTSCLEPPPADRG